MPRKPKPVLKVDDFMLRAAGIDKVPKHPGQTLRDLNERDDVLAWYEKGWLLLTVVILVAVCTVVVVMLAVGRVLR